MSIEENGNDEPVDSVHEKNAGEVIAALQELLSPENRQMIASLCKRICPGNTKHFSSHGLRILLCEPNSENPSLQIMNKKGGGRNITTYGPHYVTAARELISEGITAESIRGFLDTVKANREDVDPYRE